MKQINEYTVDELSAKIKAIKAEREKMANALKRYEEELEKRKQEVPLGVLCDGKFCVNFNGAICDFSNEHSVEEMEYNIFNTIESAQKHREMLLDWRKDGLLANAKGEQIDIKVLLPLMKKGWVAYCPISRSWFWTNEIPRLVTGTWEKALGTISIVSWIGGFNIKPADDWETSLMECGL